MRHLRNGLVLFVSVVFASSCERNSGFPDGRWVDLSYDFSSETVYWPTAAPFVLDTVAAGVTAKGYYYSAFSFCAAEHGGTHVDAPVHFAEGKMTVDEIPFSRLIAPAIKVDVSDRVEADPDYLVSVEDFERWETQHGRIPAGSIVLLQTGFGRHWPNRAQYLGTETRGIEGVAQLHFPGIHPQAAVWLADQRKIAAIGIDTASIDRGQSQAFESHVALMTRDIPAFENVAYLDEVPATGAHVVALPMKIKGGSGGPLRMVAWIPRR